MIKQKEQRQREILRRITPLDNDSGQWNLRPFKEAIALLSSFSLINVDDVNGHISMHPLVHSWAQDR